jgi:predicted RNA-binding Zn ribbon-like protein
MTEVSLERLPRLGGMLCLDFVNSIDPRYGPDRIEYLPDYRALVDWAVWAGAWPARRRAALLDADPARADAVLERAHALRDHLHVLLGPRGRAGDTTRALRAFNRELRNAARHAELRPGDERYVRGWASSGAPDEVLGSIVLSAADLMVSPALERVRECDGHDCGWLFLDTSKAGRRRWCSMRICGNRAKAQRHRRRMRTA